VADLQRQCHQSVEVVVGWRCLLPLSIHMLYDDTVTWRVWAAKKAHQPPLPCGQVFNQRLGEGHPDRKPRRAVVLGRMRSEPRERPAVYPAFALRATRGSSSLEDQTSSFSTDDVDVWRYAAVCCMPETTTTNQAFSMPNDPISNTNVATALVAQYQLQTLSKCRSMLWRLHWS